VKWRPDEEIWVACCLLFDISRGTALDTADDVRKTVMRKYLASIVFTGCALAASPLVAAPPLTEADDAAPAVAVQHVRVPASGGLRDEAAMVLVGTALICLGAAVRRAA
jgi:hypothetical protein